jgi:acylphosphatase
VSASERTQRRGYVARGRVQGVGFRWWTHREALRLNVRGTVRNLSDGSVEVMAVATRDALEHFERSLRRGPPMSDVEQLVPVGCTLPDDVEDFTIVH